MDVFFIGEDQRAWFQITVESSPQVSVSSLEVIRVHISSCGLHACERSANSSGLVLYDSGVTSEGEAFEFTLDDTDAFSFSITERFNVETTSFDTVSLVCLVKVNYEGNDGKKRSYLAIAQNIDAGNTQIHAEHDFSVTDNKNGNGASSLSIPANFLISRAFRAK